MSYDTLEYAEQVRSEALERFRRKFIPGTRIQIDKMQSSEFAVNPGSKGTVESVDDAGINVLLDSGDRISIVPGEDEFSHLSLDDQIREAKAVRDETRKKGERHYSQERSYQEEDEQERE